MNLLLEKDLHPTFVRRSAKDLLPGMMIQRGSLTHVVWQVGEGSGMVIIDCMGGTEIVTPSLADIDCWS